MKLIPMDIAFSQLATVLLIGLFTDTTCSLNNTVSIEYRLKGDTVQLKCPIGRNNFTTIWREKDSGVILTYNQSDNLYGRVRELGLLNNNTEHVTVIENITKNATGNFCCPTKNAKNNAEDHCTQVVIYGMINIIQSGDQLEEVRIDLTCTNQNDVTIKETDDYLFCNMSNNPNIFSYTWKHFLFSGYHLKCDDVKGQSFYFKSTSIHRFEGKYTCMVNYINKSIENGLAIRKSFEIEQKGLSCEGNANIEYLTKHKTIIISFLVQSANIMNHTWKRNEINLVSSKYDSNVRMIKDAVTICDEIVSVNSTLYSLEIKGASATDYNHSYTLVVSSPKGEVSCSHYLIQKEIEEIEKTDMKTNVMVYYILVCSCLAILFGTSTLVISIRMKSKRRK